MATDEGMAGRRIELHDATPAAPGEAHGPGGPTHAYDLPVEYEYQLEQWLIDLATDGVTRAAYPDVVRVVDRVGRRRWVLRAGRFEREPWPPMDEVVEGHPWIGRAVRCRAGDPAGIWYVHRVVLEERSGITFEGPDGVEVVAQLVDAERRREAVASLDLLEVLEGPR